MHHSATARRGLALTTAAALAASMAVGVVWSPHADAATGGTQLYAIATTDVVEDATLLDQALWSIDVADASASKVVDLSSGNVRGMDFSPLDNQLYVTQHDGNDCDQASLGRVSLDDGAVTTLFDTNLYAPDAAFAADGTFYVWDEFQCRPEDSTGPDDLWAIDIEAETIVELGDSGLNSLGTGVAVGPDGTIWVYEGNNLATIDPNTGAGTLGVVVDRPLDNSLAFGPDGTLYGIDRDGATTNLYTIDTTDGSTTLVGDMGIEKVVAIAFRDADPVANDDEATVTEGGTVDVDVTANDTDAEGSDLTPTVATEPDHGTVEVNPDDTITYTHDGSETTTDSFTYTVSDGMNTSNEATVSIAVDPTGLTVTVLGGELVVSEDVVDDVDDIVSGGPTGRYAGEDRYETAVDISEETFPAGADVAYVANASTDEKYPDALAGGPSAALNGGPVLLITRDTVPDVVKDELDRLDPDDIVILGGDLAVAPELEEVLAEHTDGDVHRWGGEDRFETSAIVSENTFDPGVDTVWIATGRNFADALAAGTAAYQAGGPVLLVEQDSIPASVADELDRLDPANIFVAGGPVAVSDDVVDALEDHTDGAVTRVSGETRYDTAAKISEMMFGGSSRAFLATGLKFPDALAGVVAAALADAPILLTDTTLPEATSDELARLEDEA